MTDNADEVSGTMLQAAFDAEPTAYSISDAAIRRIYLAMQAAQKKGK